MSFGNVYFTTSGVFGNTSSDAVTYTITNPVAHSGTISTTSFSTLTSAVNAEWIRRGYSARTQPVSTKVSASDINSLRNAINVGPTAIGTVGFKDRYGYQTYQGYVGTDGLNKYFSTASAPSMTSSAVSQYTTIYASTFANMATDVKTAGNACICNCNYCTCNCNYCTCNCNYNCTCNCNYSDERLKENIEFVRTEHGLNLYSFNYIWDKAKTFVGVMAQEILNTKYAHAISTDKDGYYTVNYSLLPVKMEG